jgi:hypothetical protein
MKKLLGVMCVSAALGMTACGSKGDAPTAPSSGGGATSLTAALITGTVRNGASGTVGVAGTSMTAALDTAGHFSLANVPTGDVRLQVITGGANATVPIAAVQAAQTIEVVVTVSGASANVESEVRHGVGETELKGVVEAVPPTTAASTFRAAGKLVVTNASTAFDNGTLASLTIGMHVEAKGTLAGDTLTATRVEIEDARPATPTPGPTPTPPSTEAEFSGTISALTGTAASFQFTVGSRVVKGDSTTSIIGSSNTVKSFADLKNGGAVEVKGIQRDGFVQASRIHLEGADDDNGDDNQNDKGEADAEGTLGAVSGTCPVITSSVGATKFATTASTRFDGAACTAFKSGDKVEVKGTKKADGSIAATRVEKK